MHYAIDYTSSATAADIIATADLKAHLRVDHNDENTLIEALRDAAIAHVENYCNVKLGDVTAVMYLDGFPMSWEIPVGPVQSIASIAYNNTTTTTQTLASTAWYADLIRRPARVSVINPPSVADYTHNGVQITCTIGYPEAEIPAPIIHAIRLIVGHYYEQRQQVVVGVSAVELPFGIHALLNPYRIVSFK